MKKNSWIIFLGLLLVGVLAACSSPQPQPVVGGLQVLAAESFLADIAQNVAGERLQVQTLVPVGLDAHIFEPTPQDIGRVAKSQVLIINGAGFEAWLEPLLANAGGERLLIEASAGLEPHPAGAEPAGEPADEHPAGDPHFWLDPLHVVRYVENIRDGLSQADPAGKEDYARNAEAYIKELTALDAWIRQQVAEIPAERRLLVTNHETFGYFAERYGFTIVGAVIPGVSSASSPSAQQMAALVDQIRSLGAPAIFLETGSSPQLADQLARETGARVVTGLYTHSITAPNGEAPTYLDMLRFDVRLITEALK